MSGFISVGYFLTTLFFSLVLFALWSRIFLRLAKISYLNPLSQLIYKVTNPLVKPIEGLLSPKKTNLNHYDWACFIVILIVEMIKFVIISFLLYGTVMPLSYLFLFAFADVFMQPCNILFYLILVRVVMSWVNPHWQHPASEVIRKITDPMLAWGRYILPDISGFDFSPFLILIILKVITLFMSASLPLKLL